MQTSSKRASRAECVAALRLYRTRGVGPMTFHSWVGAFGGSAADTIANLPELIRRAGKARRPFKLLGQAEAEKEIKELEALGGCLLLQGDPQWPKLLAFDDAPPLLSVLGHPSLFERPAVAVVGSRNASINGMRRAAQITRDLASEGWLVVSGMARGIDTAAHEGSLLEGTVAVLAGGVNVPYPNENKALYEKIVGNGIVVSEAPLNQPPLSRHFPRRNRIISGIAYGTVVIEANLNSGSLGTAEHACAQKREVMAVPGETTDPHAQGCNKLIRDGASAIASAKEVGVVLRAARDAAAGDADLFRERIKQSQLAPQPLPEQDRELRERIADFLIGGSETPIPEVVRATQAAPRLVTIALMEMELAGSVQRVSGNQVTLLAEGQAWGELKPDGAANPRVAVELGEEL